MCRCRDLLVVYDWRQRAAHLNDAVLDALLSVLRAVLHAVDAARPHTEPQLRVGQQTLAARAACHALGMQLENWRRYRQGGARAA